MSASRTAPKEIASLLRLAAASLENPDDTSPQDLAELIEDLDLAAEELYPQNQTSVAVAEPAHSGVV